MVVVVSEEAVFKRVDKSLHYRIRSGKNMLLIIQDSKEYGESVNNIRRTFDSFNFEIEEYTPSTSAEAVETCAKLFENRNFTRYGTFVMVVLIKESKSAQKNVSEMELLISKYMYNQQCTPPTLRGKPKIIIWQQGLNETARNYKRSYIEGTDVFELFISPKSPSIGRVSLDILCDILRSSFFSQHFVQMMDIWLKKMNPMQCLALTNKMILNIDTPNVRLYLRSDLDKLLYFWIKVQQPPCD